MDFMKRKSKTRKNEIAWDRKSIIRLILTITLFSVLFFGSYFIPSYYRDRKSNELSGRTTGIVVKIEPKSIQTQGFYGRKESTYSYKVTFVYTVESKTYTNTNNFSVRGKYSELIGSIQKSNFTKEIDINYNEENPQESLIIAN